MKKNKKTEEEKNLEKLLVYRNHPFANKVYVALKTGLSMEFVKQHWDKLNIT